MNVDRGAGVYHSWSLRLPGALLMGAIGLLAIGLALHDLLAERVSQAVWVVAVAIALGAAVYEVLWRPEVRVTGAGVVLVNALRTITVPWPLLEETSTVSGLRLTTSDGHYTSSAVPMGPRIGGAWSGGRALAGDNVMGMPAGMGSNASPAMRDLLQGRSGSAVTAPARAKHLVDQAWQEWQRSGRSATSGQRAAIVTTTWRRGCIALALTAVVIAVAAGYALVI